MKKRKKERKKEIKKEREKEIKITSGPCSLASQAFADPAI